MSDDHDDVPLQASLPEAGRVNRVRNEWLLHGDSAFAEQLQHEEYKGKYRFNKDVRRTARTDVPLAKFVQTEEEARIQRERLELLEQQNMIAERDAELAQQVHKLEEEKTKYEQRNLESEDAAVAARLQQEENLRVEHERIRAEIRDQEYARLLYEKERRKYEEHLQKRELARERKRLEAAQQAETGKLLSGYQHENNTVGVEQRLGSISLDENEGNDGHPPSRMLRTDGRVEDLGDFSDFYTQPDEGMQVHERKQLQEKQDEELARLLQDQEKKRGAQIDKTALRSIEERDAELARIMQEQEKLRAKRRHRPGVPRHRSTGERTPPPDDPPPGSRLRSDPGELPVSYPDF